MIKPVATVSQLADYLVTGYWAGRGGAHDWGSTTITVNLSGLTFPDQLSAARLALVEWSRVADVIFQEVGSGPADITTSRFADGAYTSASWGGGLFSDANVNVAADWDTSYEFGTYGFQTFLHEFGHALGLGHQGPYNGDEADPAQAALYADDCWQFSVMSYNDQSYYAGGSVGHLTTPMLADIVAVQRLYGANNTTDAGNTRYGYAATHSAHRVVDGTSQIGFFTIWDGGGFDLVDLSGSALPASVDLGPGRFSSTNGHARNFAIAFGTVVEAAFGGAAGDRITGNVVGNDLRGFGGDDVLSSLDGNDRLDGGAGGDQLYGGVGVDILTGGPGADRLDGGLGVDRAIFYYSGGGVRVNLTTGVGAAYAGPSDADGERVFAVEEMSGSNYADALAGNSFANQIWGQGGNDLLSGVDGDDQLHGGPGDDQIYGGNGTDTITGGLGADRLDGGGHDDRVSYASSAAGVRVNLTSGFGSAYAAPSDADGDRLYAVEHLTGTNAADVLIGSTLANQLTGLGGSDLLIGGDGADQLLGAEGNDALFGDAGNDTLVGGLGTDRLTGGAGLDRFVWQTVLEMGANSSTVDVVLDFAAGDQVDLQALDGDGATPGRQALSWIGAAAFSGSAAELRTALGLVGALLLADLDGDAVADRVIRFDGYLVTLNGGDLLL